MIKSKGYLGLIRPAPVSLSSVCSCPFSAFSPRSAPIPFEGNREVAFASPWRLGQNWAVSLQLWCLRWCLVLWVLAVGLVLVVLVFLAVLVFLVLSVFPVVLVVAVVVQGLELALALVPALVLSVLSSVWFLPVWRGVWDSPSQCGCLLDNIHRLGSVPCATRVTDVTRSVQMTGFSLEWPPVVRSGSLF